MNRIKFLVFLVFLGLFSLNSNSFSQKYIEKEYDPRFNYGLFANGGMNLHLASFTGFEGIPFCCPGFESGTGFGLNLGFFLSFPVGENYELSLRPTYSNLSGKLTKDDPINGVYNPLTNGTETGTVEHAIDAKLSTFGLNTLFLVKLTNQLRVGAGIKVGLLLTKQATQSATLIKPSYGSFYDSVLHSSYVTKSVTLNDIPNASSLNIGLNFYASYDMPLNTAHTVFLVPEANLTYGVNSILSDFSWHVITITAGVGIRFAPRKVEPPKPPKPIPAPPAYPPYPAPFPPPAAPNLDAVIKAVAVDKDNAERSVSTIRVEEFLLNRTHPILKYVFFDENNSEIPERYHRASQKEKDEFSFKNFYKMKTMDVYYQVLNILGKRLQFYPQAEITLVGCNSDQGAEKGNKALSQSRAEKVRDYLVTEWNIPVSRIKIESKNLPDVPSNIKDEDGMVENRRVEIISNRPEIMEPVIIKDTLRTANPPHIRFKPEIKAQIGIKEWTIITSQQDRNLRVFKGTGTPPKEIDWEIERESEQDYVPRLDKPLEYQLIATDNDNKVWESNKQVLPVQQLTIQKKIDEVLDDKEIDKFAIIGFDFQKSDLSTDNKYIADGAKKRIRKASEVKITGYSDRIGNDDFNKKLSQARADEVARYLGVDKKFSQGVGEEIKLYDNSTPEGRFYSRTVTIDIVTPIE